MSLKEAFEKAGFELKNKETKVRNLTKEEREDAHMHLSRLNLALATTNSQTQKERFKRLKKERKHYEDLLISNKTFDE